MKISEIQIADVAKYLRIDANDIEVSEMTAIMAASKKYIESYTGIPASAAIGATLDDYDDFYIAFMVLCQDMYDNRTYTADNTNSNKVIENILGMHCKNLI
ncbi:MAG: head-tail connector protein [Oscillospiraceae bacterium]